MNHCDGTPSSVLSSTSKTKNQARLRLIVNREFVEDLSRYAQSTSGRSSSQRTSPRLSLSMFIASDSPQGRKPYATFRKWPTVVSQRSANASRSDTGMDRKKSFRVMRHYHHTVIGNATPSGEFTAWWRSPENMGMRIKDYPAIRRANLKRFVANRHGGNLSDLARLYNPAAPKPSYFSDLLREGSGKSFGEKVARQIESAVGLKPEQLDIPDSPLEMGSNPPQTLTEALHLAIDALPLTEQQRLYGLIAKSRTAAKAKRRA